MAPERWERRPVPASDLYACGILWYTMLVGRRPFRAPTVEEIRRCHREVNPPAPSRQAPDLNPGVDALFTKLTYKDPALRYASARLLHEDLDRLENGEETVAERELKAARTSLRRPGRRPR